jgi:hypothetical protein
VEFFASRFAGRSSFHTQKSKRIIRKVFCLWFFLIEHLPFTSTNTNLAYFQTSASNCANAAVIGNISVFVCSNRFSKFNIVIPKTSLVFGSTLIKMSSPTSLDIASLGSPYRDVQYISFYIKKHLQPFSHTISPLLTLSVMYDVLIKQSPTNILIATHIYFPPYSFSLYIMYNCYLFRTQIHTDLRRFEFFCVNQR